MCFLSEFIFAQTYPGTPVSNPVRTYTQNDTKGVWVIGNGAPIFSPTAKMSQLYFDYIGQKPYFWNGSAWVDWSAGYIISAANGLTETAGTVKIGGPLIEETTIDLDGNDFIISGTGRFTVDVTSNIQLQTGGNFDLLADGKLQTFTLANMEVYAAQDIAIETDDVINIHAINGGSIIVDNNDFVLTATAGDVQINSPGTTAGAVNGIAYKADIANSVAVTDYGVNTTTAGVPDNGKVWTYNSTTNEMELQTLPSAIPGLNTIGSNQLTSGLRDSIVLNNWNTLGNAGTVQATNFIGTTDAIGLSLRTNNSIRQTILSTGEVGIGTISPTRKFSVSETTASTNSIVSATTFDLNTSATAATGLGVQSVYRVEDPSGSLLDAAGVAGMLDEAPTPDGGALLLRAGANGALSTIMSVYGKGFVGINTAGTPTDYLQLVVSGGDALGGHTIDKYDSSNPNSPANLTLSRSYGSYSSPSTIVTGARLGSINFKGYEGTSKLTMASIYAEATGTIGTNRVPTNMVFSTGTDAATSVLTEAMRITSEQLVGIGTTTPSTKLEVRTNALGTSQVTTAGIALTNETAAASGLQQISPAMRWKGYGWKTTATAASQAVEFRAYTLPLQGTTAPTGTWVLQSAINGGSYADRFSVSTSGVVGASSYNAANNGSFYWGARSALTSPSDGMLLISNNAVTDFSRLQFGGTTSSFPSLKRSSATLQVRLADDSDYADLSAARLIANNVVRLKGYTVATLPAGTQGDTAFVTDALAPAYMVAVVGGGAVVTPVFYNGTTWLVH